MNRKPRPRRSLDNYKSMHRETAQKKGVAEEFAAAKTLTQARKVLWGEKQKVRSCSGCSHRPEDCCCGGK